MTERGSNSRAACPLRTATATLDARCPCATFSRAAKRAVEFHRKVLGRVAFHSRLRGWETDATVAWPSNAPFDWRLPSANTSKVTCNHIVRTSSDSTVRHLQDNSWGPRRTEQTDTNLNELTLIPCLGPPWARFKNRNVQWTQELITNPSLTCNWEQTSHVVRIYSDYLWVVNRTCHTPTMGPCYIYIT